MGRAKVILQSEFPYNISARCINREWFNIPMQDVWKIFCDELLFVAEEHDLVTHAFVLMSNHFHLIASTPRANISECMHSFMQRTSRRLTKKGNRINQTYSGRHFKCIMQNPNYYLNAYKYVYRNPVTAGICDRVEDYPFSTLRQVMGLGSSKIPISEDATYLSSPSETLKWLNTAPPKEKMDAFKTGTRHQFFQSRKHKQTRLPILGVNDLL